METDDKLYREELHAEAELLRELTRLHISNRTISWMSPVHALTNVLYNNNSIYKANELTGVPTEMIAAILYQESLQRDMLDNKPSESVISFIKGDASFGIGQVRAETAIKAEQAFHSSPTPLHNQKQMQKLLQKDNETNIKYTAMTIWYCGNAIDTTIDSNYNFDNADHVFQGYNPGSLGYGGRVFSYMKPFQSYYKVVAR